MIFIKDTKKTKHLTRSALIFSALLMSILSFSCSNFIERTDENDEQNIAATTNNDKAYLSLKLNTKASGNSRTIIPYVDTPVTTNDLKNFVLKGVYETGEESILGQLNGKYTAATDEDKDRFTKNIELLPGNWTFTLSAEYPIDPDDPSSEIITYSDMVTNKTITRGRNNSISFFLKPQGDFGSFVLTLDLSANTSVDKVKAQLRTITGELKDSKVWDSEALTDSGRHIEFFYSGNDENPDALTVDPTANNIIRVGTYLASFEFYTGSDPTPINQWENYIRVTPCTLTQAAVTLNLNDVYTLTLKDENGNVIDFSVEEDLNKLSDYSILTNRFSTRSSFTLPSYKSSNPSMDSKVLLGWKDGGDRLYTEISPNTTNNLTLSPYFVAPVLYVSSTGDDTDLGFTSIQPVKTIQTACQKIEKYGTSNLEWQIYINGEITGIPKGKNGVNQTHGHSEIPAEITTEKAKSILITGATTHSDWLTGDVPSDLDTINRGSNGAYNSTLDSSSQGISGSALVISSSVPVTITNLKITGGNTSGSGAGILINENATVSIGDGVLITGNRASNKGGAICNKGTLYIYGSAIIGDKTDRSNYNPDDTTTVNRKYPSYSSTQNLADGGAANYAANGGGIYNGDPNASTVANTSLVAKLYLGYKPGTTSPQEETFTGGIYFCGASSGGAISNAIKSEIYMASGNLKFNGVQSDGGAIKNDDAGRIEMSGGEISHNSASYTGSVIRGGGICNLYNRSTFIMSGGKILNNRAWCTASGTNGKGGGVFNGGYMFMYGSAVIGEVPSTLPTPDTATSDSYSNKANLGGGIYNSGESGDYYGRIYIGYEPGGENGKTPVEAELSGGVYYNYSKAVHSVDSTWGGGGIYCGANNGYGEFKMASGEVAYNATNDNGGGLFGQIVTLSTEDHNISIHDNTSEKQGDSIYIVASSYHKLILGGNLDIPDICMGVGSDTFYSTIQIASALDASFNPVITPTSYLANIQLIRLTTEYQNSLGSSAAEQLAAECNKFTIAPQVSDSGITNWYIDGNGKLQQAAPNITPSMIVENAADIKFTFTADESTITKGTPTTITITPNVTFKDGNATRHLYYIDGLVYKGKSPMPQDLITDELVAWDITLWNEDEQIINPDENTHYVLTNDNTITLNIPLPDTFVIKVRATYLGYTHDAEFPITCE